jgi:hypothetical protein
MTLVVLLVGANDVQAGPGVLDLIPSDATCAIAIRNPNALKKKGDQFVAETELKTPLRPSQAYDFVLQHLGIRAGLDADGPAAVVLVDGDVVGAVGGGWENLENRLVAVIPFTDRDKMAGNFEIQAGELKPERMTTGKGQNFGKFFYARGNHLFLGNHEKAVASVAKAKSVGDAWPAGRRTTLADDDVVVHFGTKGWGVSWADGLKGAAEGAQKELEENERKVLAECVECLSGVRFALAGLRVDRGLGLSLLAVFPKNGDKTAHQLLTDLQGGPGAAELTGLPEGTVIAAQATRGDGSRNGLIAKLILRMLLNNVVQTKALFSAADQPNFLGVFTEVWKRLQGNRAALYRNADEERHGLFSLVAILDADDPQKLLEEMKQLAHFAAGPEDEPGAIAPTGKADIERLIGELGDNRFTVRESATTKLSLLGEPALPYLEKALSHEDLEVRRRAEAIKNRIVTAAKARREELLEKNLTRRLHPRFGFAAQPEMRDGRRIDIMRIRLGDADAWATPSMRQLFGPDWNKIRLAVHDRRIVVLLGSDVQLLQTAVANLADGRPGLAGAKLPSAVTRAPDPARKFEFHVSVQTVLALAAADDLKHPKAMPAKPSLSSVAVAVEPDRLQLHIWLPSAEFKVLARAEGW